MNMKRTTGMESRCKWRKRRRRREYCSLFGRYDQQHGKEFNFPTVLKKSLHNYVLVILTAGGDFSAVSGVLGGVYRDHVTIISGKIITSIPIDKIAAISYLAGGRPKDPWRI